MIDWLANKLDLFIIKVKQSIADYSVLLEYKSEYKGVVFTTPPATSTQLHSPEVYYSTHVVAPSGASNINATFVPYIVTHSNVIKNKRGI